MKKDHLIAWPASLVMGALIILGCGGAGTTIISQQCGPTYATPNYAQANDPGSGDANLLLRWSGYPLRYYIANSEQRTFGSSTTSTTEKFQEALNKWSQSVTPGAVTFTEIADQGSSDIELMITTIAAHPGQGGTLGRTVVTYYQSTGEIIKAEIEVNVWPGMTQAQWEEGLRHTMSHEIGHGLFLSGHSDDNSDLMYYQGSSSTDKPLTTKDVNTFLTAYCGDFGTRYPRGDYPNEKPVQLVITCRD